MTRRPVLRTAALAVATSAAFLTPVVPASTAVLAAPSSADCHEDSGASARTVDGGRADDHRDVTPAEQRAIEKRTKAILAERAAAQGKPGTGGTTTTVTVPVYVHEMVAKDGSGDVTDQQVADQVTVLNQTYAGADPDGTGVATGFSFVLAGNDEIVNDQYHQDRSSSKYRAATRQGGAGALNIWLVDFKYLGIATFPWDYARNAAIDGIRVNYRSLPGGDIANYNEGETATHEAGHWFGLYHTFQGGCADPGDQVADTPAQATPTTGCPEGQDTCTAPGTDPIHNYMDYSYDSCYFTFSPGQVSRMSQMFTAYRA